MAGWDPDSDYVVDKARVVEEVVLEGVKEGFFAEGVEKGRSGRGGWGSHGGTGILFPCRVAEGEDIIHHHKAKSFHEGTDRDTFEGVIS